MRPPARQTRRAGVRARIWRPAGHAIPASRYSTRLPATATFRLAPRPTIGISTHASAASTCSSGTPCHSWPSRITVPCRLQARQRDRALRQLDGHDPPAVRPLVLDPALAPAVDPVDARPPAGSQRVALGESRAVVRGVGHRHTRAHGVAGAQQRPEVGLERDPQRRHQQVVPAAVASAPAAAADLPPPRLRRGQSTGAHALSSLTPATVRRQAGRRDDSPRDDSPRDDSPRDDSPRDDSPRDDSPRDDSPRDGRDGRESGYGARAR